MVCINVQISSIKACNCLQLFMEHTASLTTCLLFLFLFSGRSRNPWNLQRSPGGSSAGDACVVSMGITPLSVSADGAGSIRIPASYCGVIGFKPTSHRLTFKGCMRPKKVRFIHYTHVLYIYESLWLTFI